MSIIFRRLFGRKTADWAANIRESIRRDNMLSIHADPHYIRDENVDGFEREQRRRHMITVGSEQC